MSEGTLLQKVLVVGGGTSGWMTAAYLQKAFGDHVKITVIESPTIKKIGVGEATVPNLQKVLFDFLEIPEREWMSEVNGAFKTAVKFVNWRKKEAAEPDNHFYHPFGILPSVEGVPLPQYWFLETGGKGKAVDYACFREPAVMDANLAPCHMDGTRAVPYAWHFDAHLVADFLTRWSTERGVEHIVENVESITLDSEGNIGSVIGDSGLTLEADLYVDCTGFRSMLLNKTLGEPFIDMTDELLCDSAVACAIPNDDENNGIEPYTSAIAMEHGWTWKIPMLGRHGTGYVYSSKFTDEDYASTAFLDLHGLKENDVNLNHIKFRTGRNKRAWVNNCVAIGLSSCFLEPLESTGIYFITASIYQLAKHFPGKNINPTLRDQFNSEVEFMFNDCKDFIQAHYFNSDRDDSEFWLANKNALFLGDSMQEKMALYKAGLPVNPPTSSQDDYYGSFDNEFHNFWTNGSYYCIFAGMGFYPDEPLARLRYRDDARNEARELFKSIESEQRKLEKILPTNYEYLKYIHADKMSGEKSPALNISWEKQA